MDINHPAGRHLRTIRKRPVIDAVRSFVCMSSTIPAPQARSPPAYGRWAAGAAGIDVPASPPQRDGVPRGRSAPVSRRERQSRQSRPRRKSTYPPRQSWCNGCLCRTYRTNAGYTDAFEPIAHRLGNDKRVDREWRPAPWHGTSQ